MDERQAAATVIRGLGSAAVDLIPVIATGPGGPVAGVATKGLLFLLANLVEKAGVESAEALLRDANDNPAKLLSDETLDADRDAAKAR